MDSPKWSTIRSEQSLNTAPFSVDLSKRMTAPPPGRLSTDVDALPRNSVRRGFPAVVDPSKFGGQCLEVIGVVAHDVHAQHVRLAFTDYPPFVGVLGDGFANPGYERRRSRCTGGALGCRTVVEVQVIQDVAWRGEMSTRLTELVQQKEGLVPDARLRGP